jgi:hypothetical protein
VAVVDAWPEHVAAIARDGLVAEFARLEATGQFQDRLLDEAFAVVRAKGLAVAACNHRSSCLRSERILLGLK